MVQCTVRNIVYVSFVEKACLLWDESVCRWRWCSREVVKSETEKSCQGRKIGYKCAVAGKGTHINSIEMQTDAAIGTVLK